MPTIRTAIALILCVQCVLSTSARAETDRPNVVIIMVDDMGYSDIGCFGGEIRTPNIDRLASNGMRFSQMYNTAKCYSSRACLQTGIYYQRTNREFARTALLGEVLKPAGYRTLWTGKHHANFNPVTRGYDRFYGLMGGAENHFNPGSLPISGQPPPAFVRGDGNRWSLNGKDVSDFIPNDGTFYDTDAFTDRALSWLKEFRNDRQPFLLYLSFTAPHWPLQAWPEDIAKYRGVYDRGYEAVRSNRYEKQIKLGLLVPHTSPLPAFEHGEKSKTSWDAMSPKEREAEVRKMEIYAAMVDRVDQNIGRLVNLLEEQQKLSNTLILFLSDNGADRGDVSVPNSDPTAPLGSVASFVSYGENWASVSNTPLRKWKSDSFEGGICTPMVAHWPARIKPDGGWNHQPVHVIDIMPTVLEVAGAKYPAASQESMIPSLDGVSLVPAFGNQPVERQNPLFFQFNDGAAVRAGQWKLVRRGARWELYDLSTDRTETNDLAASRPELVRSLESQWLAWWKETKGSAWTGKAPDDKRTRD